MTCPECGQDVTSSKSTPASGPDLADRELGVDCIDRDGRRDGGGVAPRLTDFDILQALDDHRRNVAANLAAHLERDRAYLITRMPFLHDYGLVEEQLE